MSPKQVEELSASVKDTLGTKAELVALGLGIILLDALTILTGMRGTQMYLNFAMNLGAGLVVSSVFSLFERSELTRWAGLIGILGIAITTGAAVKLGQFLFHSQVR